MARSNVKVPVAPVLTHEGARAARISPLLTLRRMCLAALLFEDQHYQTGEDHANEVATVVKTLVDMGKSADVAALAIECREQMYLRHMPLYLLALLTQYPKCGPLVADALPRVALRADEPGEFMAIYAKLFPKAQRATVNYQTGLVTGSLNGIKLSAGAKRGLAKSMRAFSAYDLAKYNRDGAVKLADVLRLVHPTPKDADQAAVWRALVAGTLESPDTWEVALSAGGDKKATFERLLREKKLGGLAFLRNLRNMQQAGVERQLIVDRFGAENGFKYVLPFRFIAAAKHAPDFEPEIEQAMIRTAGTLPKLTGHTVLVVDVSGSMGTTLSAKSELSRLDAAAALSILAREQCEQVTIVVTAGDDGRRVHATMKVPPRRGMALRDAIVNDSRAKVGGGGIFLVQCMDWVEKNVTESCDRVIVFTDEADCDLKLNPANAKRLGKTNYLLNIGAYQTGIAYKPWVHVDGFSEHVLDFIREDEQHQ